MTVGLDGIDIDLYCVGDGSTNDTVGFQNAIQQAISLKKPLILGARNYWVNDTLLNAVSTNNIQIVGQGMDISRITFSNNVADKPLFKLELCQYPIFKDFTILGTGVGVGIMIGRYVSGATGNGKWNAVSYGQFHNLKVANLTTSIHHDAGWINDFYNCNVRDSITGIKIHGNHLNFFGLTAEANDIGVDLINDDENSTVNFFGGCIEINNQIGMKVRFVHDLNMYGVYFEKNPQGHIVAGTDPTDKIDSITIVGGSLHFPHPIIFDRVDSLSITGLAEHMTPAPLTITENVKQLNIPALFQQNFEAIGTSTIEGIEIRGKNRASSTPWFLNDFTGVTIPVGATGNVQLDQLGEVLIQSENGALMDAYTADFLTGTSSMKVAIPAAKTHAGMRFSIRPTYIKSDYMSAKIPVFLASTLKTFRIKVDVRYNLTDNSLQTLTTYDYVPAFAGDYGLNKMLNRWMTFTVPINLSLARSQLNFRNFFDIKFYIYGVTSPAATGDEFFLLDSVELYPTKYITEPYNDTRSSIFRPLEINPTSVVTENVIQGGKRTWYRSAVPITGAFNQGDYVKNTAPVLTGGAVITGWIRLTSGSAHVLGTDWAEDVSGASAGGTGAPITSNAYSSPSGLKYLMTVSDAGAAVFTNQSTAYDLFDRANSTTTLGASNLGGAWTAVNGTWGISANAAYPVTNAQSNLATLPYPSGSVYCTIKTRMKGTIISNIDYTRPGLAFRYIDASNFLLVRLEAALVTLSKNDVGTFTVLGTATVNPQDDVYADIRIVNKTDDSIEVYYNDTLAFSYQLTAAEITKYGSAKTVGMRLNKAGAPLTQANFDKIIVEPTP